MKNVLMEIESTAECFPNNVALADDQTTCTYRELLTRAQYVGSHLGRRNVRNRPVAIYLEKTPDCVAAMLGVAYSGNFYVVLDTQMPAERIRRIFETLHPTAVLTDQAHEEAARIFAGDRVTLYETALAEPLDRPLLDDIRSGVTASDPFYILYTSGSTGRPKGTVVSHQAVLAYTDWAIATFHFDAHTVFGSQTPFYFSMSVTDLYSALRTGGRLQIIPGQLFSFPLPLMEYLNRNAVNTLYWVPSALCIVASWDTFAYAKPKYLEKVLFAGEVMPVKQLNYWRRQLPDLFYANLFGPTETTDICTYYIVDRDFADGETLPIGRPCDNCKALILNEQGQAAEQGELYIGGPFLADGYYNDPEKTQAAFVQNPQNTAYPETLYRTGDLVTRRENGELAYLGRRDFQIKHMGYRIELGEIEANAGAAEGVGICVCVYDSAADRLVLLYQGKAEADAVLADLQSRVPAYMLPNKVIRIKTMPYNASGKIDRKYLQAHYQEFAEDGRKER